MADSNLSKKSYQIDASKHCKGLALIATRRISRGELILKEKALIRTEGFASPTQLKVLFDSLTDMEKQLFMSLHDCKCNSTDSKTIGGIMNTNCLPLGYNSTKSGLFPTISRINHSCNPNVNHYWNEQWQLECVYALKDIEVGEELLTSYIELFRTRAERQALLQTFCFDCCCVLCSISDKDKLKKSDIRRRILRQLDEDIATVALLQPQIAMAKVETLLKVLEEEKMTHIGSYVGRASYDAFQILFYTTKKNLSFWAKKVYDNCTAAQGELAGPLKNEILCYISKEKSF